MAYLKDQWPLLTEIERTSVISEVNKTTDIDQNFSYHLQSALLEIAMDENDKLWLAQLLARMDIDMFFYSPLEYELVRGADEIVCQQRLSILCVEPASDLAVVPTAAQRSLRRANSQVCPEIELKSDAEICQWMMANWEHIQVDPNYEEKLREWNGITQEPPPLLIEKNP